VKFEIGHVLFLDIVGYSKLLINEQSDQIQKLKEIVRGTEQVRIAEAEGKLLRLPTGDGGALVFRTSPEAPVLCAMEISKELKNHSELRVRMGIHSGPVNEVTDLNEQANIAGAGINIAQRVMDCGDAGHILLSRHVAEDLEHYPRWQSYLNELGECEVKHGVRIGIVNLYGDGIGNSQVPKKFQVLKKRRAKAQWTAIATALMLLGAVVTAFFIVAKKSARSTSTIPEKSIAVLPFENLSEDKANAYFADGIQDEILTKLASIADLKVISRTSAAKYKSKPEDLRAVSQQLGVATVVEGTVQRAADKVRVNVQLIDARADSHLWAKTFDREIKDVFAVESEVSQEIADALQAKLSPKEANNLATAPTGDPEAHDLFLKGEYAAREADGSRKPEIYDQAATWYRQAIARDPNFALAIARLVESRVLQHWASDPLSDAELDEVKKTAEHALALAPNLPEGRIALGLFYYFGKLQYDQALNEFEHALELQPNNVRALGYVAGIHRRKGQWERSLSEFKRCEQLDPLDSILPSSIGASYLILRMWKEAHGPLSRSLALDPHNAFAMRDLVFSCLNGTGDVKEATRLLGTFPAGTAVAPTRSGFGTVMQLMGLTYMYVIQRDFAAALKNCPNDNSDPATVRARLSARAAIHVLAGNAAGAQAEIETARGLVEARLREHADDKTALTQLSWIDLALKRDAEAIKHAREAVDLMPPEKDAVGGPLTVVGLAEIEARLGETSEAVKNLQKLLSIPAGFAVSIQRLKIDPVWDPIRNDPGFQQLLAGKELIGPNK
jgi:TolB-like protein